MPMGPLTLAELIGRLVPCADINLALPPGDANSGVCEATIVAPLANQLAEQIEGWGAGLDAFTFAGSVRIADSIPDLAVDRLLDGRWDGAFGEAEALVEEVGTFSGCRVGQCEAEEGDAP